MHALEKAEDEADVGIYSEMMAFPPSFSDWKVTPTDASLDDDDGVALEDVQDNEEVVPDEEDASEKEDSCIQF